MINFTLSISNPWHKSIFENTWSKAYRVTKYKNIEIELIKQDYHIFKIGFNLSIRKDHAGFGIELALFRYEFDLTFYDGRHWNSEKETWEIYDDTNS